MTKKALVEMIIPVLIRTSSVIGEKFNLDPSYVLQVMVREFGLHDVFYNVEGFIKEARLPDDVIQSVKAYMRPVWHFVQKITETNTLILKSNELRILIPYLFQSSVTMLVGKVTEALKRVVVPELLKVLYEYGSGSTITIVAEPTSYEWIKKYFIDRLIEKVKTANVNCYVSERIWESRVLFDKGIVIEAGGKGDKVYVSTRTEDIYAIYLNTLSIVLNESPVYSSRSNIARSTLIVPLLPFLRDLTKITSHYDLRALVYSVINNSVSVLAGSILGVAEAKSLVSLILDTYDDIVNVSDIRSPKTDYILIYTDIKIGRENM